jgi:hypothetical protein
MQFEQEQFSSWTAVTWIVLHSVSFYCNDENKVLYREFIVHLLEMVPCNECRDESISFLEKQPLPDILTVDSLFQWTVEFHNSVNIKLGKKTKDVALMKNNYQHLSKPVVILLLKNYVHRFINDMSLILHTVNNECEHDYLKDGIIEKIYHTKECYYNFARIITSSEKRFESVAECTQCLLSYEETLNTPAWLH